MFFKAKTSIGAGSRQAWLLLGAALAVTALIGLLLSVPAAVTHPAAPATAVEPSQTALFWAVAAAVVLLPVAVLLGVMLQLSRLARRRALALVARLHKSLNESEAALRAVSDCSHDGIIMVDANGRMLSFNRAAERLFGFRAEEVLGQHAGLLLPHRHRDDLKQSLDTLNPLGWGRHADVHHEITGLRRDGRELPLKLTLNVIDLAGPRRLVGVLRDLSVPRAAPAAMLQAELPLALHRQDAQLLLDALGRVQLGNAEAERLLGRSGTRLTGMGLSELLPQAAGLLSEARHAGLAERRRPLQDEEGVPRSLLERVSALHDAQGRLLGFSVLLRDEATAGVPARVVDAEAIY